MIILESMLIKFLVVAKCHLKYAGFSLLFECVREI